MKLQLGRDKGGALRQRKGLDERQPAPLAHDFADTLAPRGDVGELYGADSDPIGTHDPGTTDLRAPRARNAFSSSSMRLAVVTQRNGKTA